MDAGVGYGGQGSGECGGFVAADLEGFDEGVDVGCCAVVCEAAWEAWETRQAGETGEAGEVEERARGWSGMGDGGNDTGSRQGSEEGGEEHLCLEF